MYCNVYLQDKYGHYRKIIKFYYSHFRSCYGTGLTFTVSTHKLLCDSNGMFFFSGDISIPDGMVLTVKSDLNGASPQFTLTCISTGGPATTVTWTRDSVTAMGDAVTVLDNATTAKYTHTLTVTGRLGGLYQCNVSNNKPSLSSANLTVKGVSSSASYKSLRLEYQLFLCIYMQGFIQGVETRDFPPPPPPPI